MSRERKAASVGKAKPSTTKDTKYHEGKLLHHGLTSWDFVSFVFHGFVEASSAG
jgi:hypothetical protein